MLQHLRFTQTRLTNHKKMNIWSYWWHNFFFLKTVVFSWYHFTKIITFTFKSIVCSTKQAKKLTSFYKFISEDGRTYRLNKQWEYFFSLSQCVNQLYFSKADLVVCQLITTFTYSFYKHFVIAFFQTMDINVTSMKSFVLFSSSSSKAFHIVLKFSFHDTTENNNITTYTGIDEIVSDFTVYSFWHLSSVYILYISINFLDPYSLEKRSFSCVFLGIKNS